MKIRYLLCLIVLVTRVAQGQFISNTGISIDNSTLVTTNGSWVNNVGTTITNHGTITTSDSFVNNGLLNVVSTGGFIFIANSDVSFVPGGTVIPFLRKEGSGMLTLGSSIIIRDSLLLNEGVITFTNSTDTIAVANDAFVSASPNAYVEGMFARGGNGELYFPIGKDGVPLPLRLHQSNVTRATASVIDAPVLGTGPGIEALIGFPYAWKVAEKVVSDTASFVEVSYPDALPVVPNPIVTRQNGSNYLGMGARSISTVGNTITVKSYSRGLKGVFSIAQGFPVDPVTDSLALVALYDSTRNNGEWTNAANWKAGSIDNWHGVSRSGLAITGLALPDNNLSGKVPQQLTDILGLEVVNLSNNALTSIPDFTVNPEITVLDVSNNNLTFETLEPNAGVAGFVYSGQGLFGVALDSIVEVGTPYEVTLNAGGDSTVYTWTFNGQPLNTVDSATLHLEAVVRSNMGEYVMQATNNQLPGLTLTSQPQTVRAYANLSGNVILDENVPATAGNVTLYKVQAGAFDSTQVAEILEDGSYQFPKVVLADYQIMAFADTLLHEGSLPTYYKNTIFWEEADTVFVDSHRTDLAIGAALFDGPGVGTGLITGTLSEDDGNGRQTETQANKRVQGAGVSARKVERGGRGKEDVIGALVAYTFTNEEGEFSLTNLPEGDYRIDIQYPGYPLDKSSDIIVQIGGPLQQQVRVEANVVEGMINVRKMVITGIFEQADYKVELYPNPVVDYIHLKFGHVSMQRSISLIDINGKVLNTSEAVDTEAVVRVQDLNKGIYILNVSDNGKTVKTVKVSID